MQDQLDATISDLLVIKYSSTCFEAPLRPSSGGQTAFLLPMVFCPAIAVVMLESRLARQYTRLATRLPSITTATTGQKTIGSENAVWPPDDRRKDARSILRNNLLPIKSLIVASSWSRIYLFIKDARSSERKVSQRTSIFKHWMLISYSI